MRAWPLLVLALTTCANRPASEGSETVTVRDLRPEFSPGDEGQFTLTLTVRNPEGRAARIGRLQVDVWMNNHWFASASSAPPSDLDIPPGGVRDATFVLPVSFRREGSKPESIFVTFGLRGTLQVVSDGNETVHAFKDRRRLEVKNAPVVRLPDAK